MSDPAFTCYMLDRDQHHVAEDARMELAHSRGKDPAWLAANNATYGWARLGEVVKPCAMWFVPWYYDPLDPEDKSRRDWAMKALADGTFGTEGHKSHLSRHYWTSWSLVRPPLCVLCPNGQEWCVDARSSNGDGWVVTGEPPAITAAPSIQVPGYHGFLQGGVFTPNM